MIRSPQMSSSGLSRGSSHPRAPERGERWMVGTLCIRRGQASPTMTTYWFKPKRYGFGATPSNWKGWAATAAFALVVLATSLVTFGWQLNGGTQPGVWQIAAWLLAVAVLADGFVLLARAKTDGQWGWRWGK